ncbi:unnamed protein product [Allacma fusca]|uniref:Uncharacterized protein n=1 Tax=Allacma fusca TaxID=39272 RepID=A0A8J2LKI1_9HEXA|nr:unnamed protein product [Allacma fusca]
MIRFDELNKSVSGLGSVAIQGKMALVPGLDVLNTVLRHCASLVTSWSSLHSAATAILGKINPLLAGGAAVGTVAVVYLPDILRQTAIWIARVRREVQNISQSLKLSLEQLEGHLTNMGY